MSDSCQQPTNGFAQFNLDPSIMKGIQNAGFDQPRPIQAQTLPAALDGRDILGLAPTGTGKTAGFALPILERIVRHPGTGPHALILAPTRELAAQITSEFRLLSKCTRIKTISIYGGVSQKPQVDGLRNRPDVIVACPGRLLDLIEQGHAKLGKINTLVLDEADHMFDMGFLKAIRKILGHLPKKRQNLLFSATMPKAIRHLADDMLHKPHVVELAHKKPLDLIEQVIYPVHPKQKLKLLEHLFATDSMSRAIVFTRTKRGAKKLAQRLERTHHRAVALQGNMSQSQRERVMKGFRAAKFDVLVATDIVARGIDVAGISHVVNYDAPDTPEAYAHRIGRTGRAERTGKACTFITQDDRALVRAVERRTKQALSQVVLQQFAQNQGESEDSQTSRSSTRKKPAGSRPARNRNRRGNSPSKNRNQESRNSASKTAEGTPKRKPVSATTNPDSNRNSRPSRTRSATSPSSKYSPKRRGNAGQKRATQSRGSQNS